MVIVSNGTLSKTYFSTNFATIASSGNRINIRSTGIQFRVHIGYFSYEECVRLELNLDNYSKRHTLHQLKCPNGLSELFPFMYILDSVIKRCLH